MYFWVLSSFFFAGFTKECEGTRCQPPGRTVDSLYKPTKGNYDENESVEYYCKKDHLSISKANRHCQLNATWSGDVPVCYKVMQNVQIRLLQGTNNVYSEMTDGNITTCSLLPVQRQAHFEGNISSATIVGIKLVFPRDEFVSILVGVKGANNGYIDCGHHSGNVGDKKEVTIHCPRETVGDMIYIKDLIDRQHNFSLCEVFPLLPPMSSCFTPDIPANGFGHKQVTSNITYYSFMCAQGYQLEGRENVTCLKNGTYGPKIPMCKKIHCESKPTVLHGSVILLDNSTTFGSRLQVACTAGYVNKMPKIYRCPQSGTWGQLMNVCTEISCDASNIDNSEWVLLNNSPNIRVLSCRPGSHIIGSPPVIQCLSNGSWSFTDAVCEKPLHSVATWSSDWTPSIVLLIAIAVGTGAAICILCLVMIFLVLKKRYQSRTKTTVFHVGMTNSSVYNSNAKTQCYRTTAVYGEVAAFNQYPNLSKPSKPRSALPHLPLDADPVYAQPFENSERIKKLSRGAHSNNEDIYTTHIYAEPVDSRRPPSGSSTASGCISEDWIHTGNVKFVSNLNKPNIVMKSNNDDLCNDKFSTNTSYKTLSLNCQNITTNTNCQPSHSETSLHKERQEFSILKKSSIYHETFEQELKQEKMSEQVYMIDNDIYLSDS